MNEGTGTADQNLVDGQVAQFSGVNLPGWNTFDPSIVFLSGGSLNSFLNAGTDSIFDQLTTNQMTVVAKIYVNGSSKGKPAPMTAAESLDIPTRQTSHSVSEMPASISQVH